MYNFSIPFIFSFRWAKIDSFEQIVEPEKGMALFTYVSLD